ncbi:MAG: hypothetical protein IKC24_00070 [Oscillospiraceae bacterium]|nr:hypothetical protein [Oscillospiraceae bacterium]
MGFFEKIGRLRRSSGIPTKDEFRDQRVYDYTSAEGRVNTAEWLFAQAKSERTGQENLWKKYDDYYNGSHEVAAELQEQLTLQGIEWTPPAIPDPYIMVESQIIPEVPQPEFRGRDDDQDGEWAKKRAFAVKYICEANRLNDMNTSNERRLRKYGDAFWKAYWDDEMRCGNRRGDIRIKDIPVEDIYIDPTAGKDGLQAAEYVVYVYSMHKLRFWRTYREELQEKGISLDDITGRRYQTEEGMFEPFTAGSDAQEDLVQVMEFWFKQPEDAEDGVEAGSIACSIQAGGQEIRYIEKYWEETGKQCRLFPFVHYWCIRDESQFYNRSELAPILSMVDAADRELSMGILNDAFMANDIVLVEEGALPPGEGFTNAPGALVTVNPGRAGGVARLGGLSDGVRCLGMVEWMLTQIQRTNRNFDSNNGRETSRVSTASGLLQLRTDAQEQQRLKRADRDAGFCRLYELLDWLALEFYRDDRLLFIGAKDEHEKGEMLRYNGEAFAMQSAAEFNALGEEMAPEEIYYPRVDVTVSVGDALGKSPSMTLQVLDKLAAIPVTTENWRLLASELELLDVPGKQEIIDRWRQQFEPKVPPEVLAALESDPAFLQMIGGIVNTTNAKRAAAASQNAFPGMGGIPAFPSPAQGGGVPAIKPQAAMMM